MSFDLSWSKIHVQQFSHIQSLCCCVNKYYKVKMSDLSWSKIHVQQLSHIQSLCCCVNKYYKVKISDLSWSKIHVQQLSHNLYNHYAVVSINTKYKCLTFLGQNMSKDCFIIAAFFIILYVCKLSSLA